MVDDTRILTEHESPDNKKTKTDPQRPPLSDKDRKLIKKVERLFAEAKEHRKAYDENWIEYYKMFRGFQWREERPSYRHSEVINMIFQTIQSFVPIMTDSRPKTQFLPESPEDIALAEIMNDLNDSDWTKNNWLMQLTECIYDSHIYGTAFAHTGYDQTANGGIGNILFESEDPLYCYPDKNARDINDNRGRYFITAVPTDINEIKRKWPSKGKYVRPDIDNDISNERRHLSKTKFKSPTENVISFESTPSLEPSQKALVITAWLKDDEFEEKEITRTGEDGEEVKSFQQVLKFPKGRKVVIADNLVLQDGKNPFDDGKFPYSRLVNYILPREFYGEGEVAQLKSPQIIFNKMVSFALDVLTLMGNPIWVVEEGAIDTDNLFNAPGLIVEKPRGSEVRREEGVQLQPYVLQLIDRMRIWFDELSGATDITRGVKPAGVQAGVAIESLQQAAQTRIRQKSRNLDAFLQSAGQQYVSRVFQFYKAPRVIRLTNSEAATQFFKFSIEEDEEGKKVAQTQRINVDEEKNVTLDDVEQMEIVGSFDIKVATGSLLPFSKIEKESKLLNLFDRQIIDDQEVLKGIEYPNWEAVLQRVQERRAAELQAQQAAAAGAAGGGGEGVV
jgi:hypothetical protein